MALLPAQEVSLMNEVTVSASERYPDAEDSLPGFSVIQINREALTSLPKNQLDDVLRSLTPGFSLFRRSSSATANPTTQGASLRNIGPNGAGRTLVLLDGVPQNDPFGGWVYWNRLPPELLGKAAVVQGGGAGLFGNNALGGTIYLSRYQPQTLAASMTLGSQDTAVGTLLFSEGTDQLTFSGTIHGQSTAGYPVIREDQRGPIDKRADSTSVLFEGGISSVFASGVEMSLRASWFEEERGNGTPYTGNHTEALDLSFSLRGPRDHRVTWETLLYYQDRRYESTFSSVDETRRMETPALDQYHVPAQSLGWSFTTTVAGGLFVPETHLDGNQLILGIDARWVEGTTNERFRYVEDRFLNNRAAGGEQWLTGVFAEQTWAFPQEVKVTLGGRADYWSIRDGSRKESIISSGETLLLEHYEDRDGLAVNGRLGIAWDVTSQWQWHSAAYTGFRIPTLNELYRPFRVRNDITGANDTLEPERLVGVESGVKWSLDETFEIDVTAFWNRLNDAVANVTLLEGPGAAPDGTFIPDGGVFRQRQNIDAVDTAGIEVRANWQPIKQARFSLGYLFTDTRVRANSPQLDGSELAQAPKHVLTSGVIIQPHEQWEVMFQARYGARQYEDDLNSLELASYTVCDAGITWKMDKSLSIGLMVENIFDTEVETGRSGDGLISIGAPRWIGVKLRWEL